VNAKVRMAGEFAKSCKFIRINQWSARIADRSGVAPKPTNHAQRRHQV